jgi:hypothetical protein
MKRIFCVALAAACAIGIRVSGQTGEMPPAWAYPQAPQGTQRPPDDGTVHHLDGSTGGFTATQSSSSPRISTRCSNC